MNILDIIIIAIAAYAVLAGMYKGSITSALKLLGFGGAWYGAQRLYEQGAQMVLSNNSLMAVLNQYLEPASFFNSIEAANTTVSSVISGGESAISEAVSTLSGQFGFLRQAFSANIRTQAFQGIGIDTLADYFDQTLWVAVFNVAAFVLTFIVLYFVASLIVNLLDHVIAFPILRVFDWLIGGIFGFLRATVWVALLLVLMPLVLNVINPALVTTLENGSLLCSMARQLDLLSVSQWINSLIMGI